MAKLIWLIPILPLFGVAVNGTVGGKLGKRGVGAVACGTVLLAFLLSCGAVWELSQLPEDARHVAVSLGEWMPLGPLGADGAVATVDWGFALDPLSAVM